MFDFELLKKLSETASPSCYENEIRDIIISEIKDYVDSLIIDKMGNIVAKKGFGGASYLAHMDEVGFIVKGITESGLIKIDAIGGIEEKYLISKKIRFQNGIKGIISALPVHFQRKEKGEKIQFSDLFADIGKDNPEEVKSLIKVGDMAVFDTEFCYLSKKDKTVCGKALDNRIGVYVLIKLIKEKLIKNGEFVFTVQEETGLRGASAYCSKDFSLGVAIDTTTAFDFPDVKGIKTVAMLNHGPVISYVDRATVYDDITVSRIISKITEMRIPCQTKTFCSGGNDASAIQKYGFNHKAISISVPARNIHSACAVASINDIEAMIKSLCVISKLYDDGEI